MLFIMLLYAELKPSFIISVSQLLRRISFLMLDSSLSILHLQPQLSPRKNSALALYFLIWRPISASSIYSAAYLPFSPAGRMQDVNGLGLFLPSSQLSKPTTAISFPTIKPRLSSALQRPIAIGSFAHATA